MARRSMTYGVMPTREEFGAAWAEPDEECGKSVDDLGFSFGNDERIGSDTLTGTELWREVEKARAEWEAGDEKAGDWCSAVLGCLGFEWV